MSDPCCDPSSSGRADGPEDELGFDTEDPTMSMCCIRDLEEQRNIADMKARLLRVDPTTERIKMYDQVIGRPEDNLESEDDDDDGAIAALREARIRQMRAQAAERRDAQQLGRGSLTDIPRESDLEPLLTLTSGPVVLHLVTSGFAACEEVDEALEELAGKLQADAQFLRCRIERESTLPLRWRLTGIPCLVFLVKGLPRASGTFHLFGWPDGIQPSAVHRWVTGLFQTSKASSVLVSTARQRGGRGSGRSSSSGGSEGEEEAEEGESGEAPCAICGRMYPHQHVKAVYGSAYNKGSDDDE